MSARKTRPSSSADSSGTREKAVLYTTLSGEGIAETEEKRSRFIGYAAPVKHEEEAMEIIRSRRRLMPDATHHVWAYRFGQDTAARYSDDGEPTGSSGLPTLETIRKCGVTDAVVVVTRYFGGTLLGVGGLVRAYSHTAGQALEAAGIITYEVYTELRLQSGYADYQRIAAVLPEFGVLTDDSTFTDQVTLKIAVKSPVVPLLTDRLMELTAGRCRMEVTGKRFDYR